MKKKRSGRVRYAKRWVLSCKILIPYYQEVKNLLAEKNILEQARIDAEKAQANAEEVVRDLRRTIERVSTGAFSWQQLFTSVISVWLVYGCTC